MEITQGSPALHVISIVFVLYNVSYHHLAKFYYPFVATILLRPLLSLFAHLLSSSTLFHKQSLLTLVLTVHVVARCIFPMPWAMKFLFRVAIPLAVSAAGQALSQALLVNNPSLSCKVVRQVYDLSTSQPRPGSYPLLDIRTHWCRPDSRRLWLAFNCDI
jgi:hypothetical protein